MEAQTPLNEPLGIASLGPIPELEDLAPRWMALEAQAEGSFFTAWPWVKTLLTQTEQPPLLFSIEHEGQDLALALIGSTSRRALLGKVSLSTLNQSGLLAEDVLYPEFNGLLCPAAILTDASKALFESLCGSSSTHPQEFKHGALRVNGITEGELSALEAAGPWTSALKAKSPAPYIDLSDVQCEEDYLSQLSANKRSQIRRSNRLFEAQYGPIAHRRLQTHEDVNHGLDALIRFQTSKFEKIGKTSGFNNHRLKDFLLRLLLDFPAAIASPDKKSEFKPTTGAELLQIQSGPKTIGYLVNFHHKDTVSNYQCAFEAFSDNRLKPGLIAHTHMICTYGSQNHQIYHLLAGDQQYKKSLATNTEYLYWTELQMPNLWLKLETHAKNLKARLST
jgi:CelD/BcsL family acetyltransferase involved in cellulose biosynthesis